MVCGLEQETLWITVFAWNMETNTQLAMRWLYVYGTRSQERPIPLSNMTNPVGQDAVILGGNGFYQGPFYSATHTPHSGFMLPVEWQNQKQAWVPLNP
jgi:hypothetical protein